MLLRRQGTPEDATPKVSQERLDACLGCCVAADRPGEVLLQGLHGDALGQEHVVANDLRIRRSRRRCEPAGLAIDEQLEARHRVPKLKVGSEQVGHRVPVLLRGQTP